VLIVVGRGSDGPADVIEERARQEIRKLLPVAAAMGQMILIENVWNQMMYDHDAPPDQRPDRFIEFVDSFWSPWIGMYYDSNSDDPVQQTTDEGYLPSFDGTEPSD
jgi:hexulose-6-phosphate isomerase